MTVRVCGLGLAFLSHLLLSRTLGAGQYGSYVIALGWAMVLVVPARLGLDNSALRFATIYRESGQGADFRGLIVFSLVTICALSLAIAVALLLGWTLGLTPFSQVDQLLLLGVAITIPFSALLAWLSALIRTANRIFAAQFYEQVLRPVFLIAALGLAALAGWKLDAPSAMLATGFTVGLAAIGIALHAKASFRDIRATHPSFEHRREWLSVSWMLFLMAVVQELLNQVDVILLGILGDATQAAHFAAAWRLASLVPFGLIAIAAVSAPLIASAYSKGNVPELARIARLNARFSTLLAVVIAVLLAAAGRWALGLFGPGFADSFPVLLILLLGGLVNSFTGTVGYLLIMTGRQQTALWILSCGLCAGIAANILLIPTYGAAGSAVASALGLSVWNILMAINVRRTMGIDATALGRTPLRSA